MLLTPPSLCTELYVLAEMDYCALSPCYCAAHTHHCGRTLHTDPHSAISCTCSPTLQAPDTAADMCTRTRGRSRPSLRMLMPATTCSATPRAVLPRRHVPTLQPQKDTHTHTHRCMHSPTCNEINVPVMLMWATVDCGHVGKRALYTCNPYVDFLCMCARASHTLLEREWPEPRTRTLVAAKCCSSH